MINQSFLNKLKKEGKVALVDSSDEMKLSYLKKADDCLKSAKVLSEESLYENSIISSYYAMYNSILALLFKVGIKSENHTMSINLFEELFKEEELTSLIKEAKVQRIDRQYYTNDKNKPLTADITKEMINTSEKFLVKIKLIINKVSNDQIVKLRKEFEKI